MAFLGRARLGQISMTATESEFANSTDSAKQPDPHRSPQMERTYTLSTQISWTPRIMRPTEKQVSPKSIPAKSSSEFTTVTSGQIESHWLRTQSATRAQSWLEIDCSLLTPQRAG